VMLSAGGTMAVGYYVDDYWGSAAIYLSRSSYSNAFM